MERTRRRGFAAGAAAVALAALGVVLLAGCGSDPVSEGGAGQTVKLSPDPKGTTSVAVKVGDTVILSLAANATTGYAWAFAAGDTFAIEKSAYVPDPNPENLLGTGGTQVVTLKVTKAGTSDLTGTYARSWETPTPDAGPDLTVTITSTP